MAAASAATEKPRSMTTTSAPTTRPDDPRVRASAVASHATFAAGGGPPSTSPTNTSARSDRLDPRPERLPGRAPRRRPRRRDARSTPIPDRSTPAAGRVPVVVKDNMAVAGEPVRHGSAGHQRGTAAPRRTTCSSARLRAAGCVVLGTTRMPELAAWAFTSSAAFGATRNPLDRGARSRRIQRWSRPPRSPPAWRRRASAPTAAGRSASRRRTAAWSASSRPGARAAARRSRRALVRAQRRRTAGPIAARRGGAAGRPARRRRSLEHLPEPPTLRGRRLARGARPRSAGRTPTARRRPGRRAANGSHVSGTECRRADPPYPMTLLNDWGPAWLAGIAQEVDRLGLDEARLEPRTRTMVQQGPQGPPQRRTAPSESGGPTVACRVVRRPRRRW